MMILLTAVFLMILILVIAFVCLAYREYGTLRSTKPIEELYRKYSYQENYVRLDSISANLKMLIIGTEDNRFFSHSGIDYRQILYAIYKNIRSGRKKMGGSTITQQLAKNLYLSFFKTYRRKLVEFFLAYYIESKLSKRQIFELYLNVIYYGQNQYGINLAAAFWFHKQPKDISVNEALTLAALLPAPTKYNPMSEFALFPKARILALKKLKKHGLIDDRMAEILKKCAYNEVLANDDTKMAEKFYLDEYGKREGTGCMQGLKKYAVACSELPTVYLWGGLGEIITKRVIEDRKQKYPQKYNEKYCVHLEQYIGKSVRGFDCSGLIKRYLMGGIGNFIYDEKLDWNSEGLLQHSCKSGAIDTLPETGEICLYMPGHVGIYIGKGWVVEATNNLKFGDGVVRTKLDARKWVRWFSCSFE